MKLLDNRYKILFLSYTEPLYDEYQVEDLLTNKQLTLYAFKVKFFTDDFASFVKNNFYKLSTFNSLFLEKSLDFRRIRSIDDELAPRSYYYVCETTRPEKEFFQYAKDCTFEQKIDLFVSICRVVFFLHLHNISYSGISVSSIILLGHAGKTIVKLKNIIMHKFDLYYKASGIYKNIETDKFIIFESEKQKDIYSLGLIFFSIFNLYEVNAVYEKDIRLFFSTGDFQENDAIAVKLRALFSKILLLKFDSSFGVNDILVELGNAFGETYSMLDTKLNEKLLVPDFISNKYEMQLILSSAFLKDAYVNSENVFLLSGKDGVGKTRFLKEIEYRLQLENVLTFSFFDIGTELTELCNNFLEQTHLFTTSKKKNSKTIDLRRDDENAKNWAQEYFDFFDQCSKNMRTISQHACVVLIVDDAHKITEREFLGGLFLAAYEMRYSNFMMVVAYDSKATECENYIMQVISGLKTKNFYKKFELSDLNPSLTKELISQSVFFEQMPNKFFESVFLQSSGNPKKTLKVLNNLFKKRNLYINETSGYCELNPNYASELKTKKIDFQIINESLNKRISRFSDYDISVLKFISIFSGHIDEAWLLGNKTEVELSYFKELLNQLVMSNVLSVVKISGKTKYSISDYIIKDLILQNLTKQEAIRLHSLVASRIEDAIGNGLSEELAFHLKSSGALERARRYYIKLAIRAKHLKNFGGLRTNLLGAISCTSQKQSLIKARLYLDVSTACFEMGDLKFSKKYLSLAQVHAAKCKNEELDLEIYVQGACLYDFLFDHEKLNEFKEKAKAILSTNPMRYPKSYAGYLRIEALMKYDATLHDEALALCDTIIKLSENRPALLKEKSNTLRISADLIYRKNNYTVAKKMLDECIAISDKIGHIRGVLYGYVDLAFLYTLQNNRVKAMEYYRKIKAGSIKYKIVSSEILAIDYIANEYFNTKQYQLAYQYALHGFEAAKKNKMNESIVRLSLLLVHICFSLNDDSLAAKFFNIARKYIIDGAFYTYDLNVACIRFYMYFHEYSKAFEYLKKIEPYDVLNCGLIIDDMEIFIQLLRIESYIESRETHIDELFELLGRDENYNVLVERSYFSFLGFLRIGNTVAMRRIYDLLLNVEKTEISTSEQAKVYFVRSFFERRNAEYLLKEILKISFKFGFRILKIYSLFELARIFTAREEYDVAIAYYLEAIAIIKMLLSKLPKEQRLNYFKGKRLFIASENIEYLLNKNPRACIIGYEEPGEHVNTSYYIRFFKKDYLKLVTSKQNIYSKISPNFLSMPNMDVQDFSFVDKLNTEIKTDIQTLLKKIVCDLLATEAFIVMVKNKNDFDIVASYSYLDLEPNLKLFYKITSKDPVVLNKDQLGTLGVEYDIHSCLSFPIMRNSFSSQTNSDILGYVCLNSTYAINLIQSEGVSVLQRYDSLLGILLQSYTYYQIATVDKLTKTLTRQTLNKRMEEYSNKFEIFSVLYYDLDFFKNINDTYGHDVGDVVLSTVASVVNKQLTEPEFLGRQGGEEFVICLPGVNSKQAFERAETIRKTIERTSFLGYNFKITISIGIATFGEHSKMLMDILQKADHAMYYSKQTGKNKVTIWNDQLKTSPISFNSFSQIASMNNVLTPAILSYIVEVLDLSNSYHDESVILQKYLQSAKNLLDAEVALFVFAHDECIINYDTIMENFGNAVPFWFSNVLSFIKEKPTGLKIMSDFPSNESNAIFRNGVSILLIPLICKEKFLGALCFTTQRYIKEFTFADAAVQTFTIRLLSNACLKVYENLKNDNASVVK